MFSFHKQLTYLNNSIFFLCNVVIGGTISKHSQKAMYLLLNFRNNNHRKHHPASNCYVKKKNQSIKGYMISKAATDEQCNKGEMRDLLTKSNYSKLILTLDLILSGQRKQLQMIKPFVPSIHNKPKIT